MSTTHSYRIKETDAQKTRDYRRFEVLEVNEGKRFVVTFQSATASKSECDCPAGRKHRGCKHVRLVQRSDAFWKGLNDARKRRVYSSN